VTVDPGRQHLRIVLIYNVLSSSSLLIHCRDDCDSLSLILSLCSFPLMLISTINVLYLSLYSQCIPSTLFVPTNLFAFGLLIYWDTFFVSLSLWLFLTAMLMATSISARNIILWIYCLPMFWFPNFCFEAILCALCVADGDNGNYTDDKMCPWLKSLKPLHLCS